MGNETGEEAKMRRRKILRDRKSMVRRRTKKRKKMIRKRIRRRVRKRMGRKSKSFFYANQISI